MKKFLLIFAAFVGLFLTSCVSSQHYSISTAYMDYSRYTQNGFFITEANTVPFDYTALGSMTVDVISGVDKSYVAPSKSSKDYKFDEMYGSPNEKKPSKWHYATPDEALAAIVERAKTFDADGIVGLNIKAIINQKSLKIEGYTVSGMIINRK